MARVNHRFGKDVDGDGVISGSEMFIFNCEEDEVEELKAEKESEGYVWVEEVTDMPEPTEDLSESE